MAATDALIAFLDDVDGDPDREPYLGVKHPLEADEDREVDVADEPHDEDADREMSARTKAPNTMGGSRMRTEKAVVRKSPCLWRVRYEAEKGPAADRSDQTHRRSGRYD
jgi:hypothetical protein